MPIERTSDLMSCLSPARVGHPLVTNRSMERFGAIESGIAKGVLTVGQGIRARACTTVRTRRTRLCKGAQRHGTAELIAESRSVCYESRRRSVDRGENRRG